MAQFETWSADQFRSHYGLDKAGKVEGGAIPKKKNKSKEKQALERLIRQYCEGWGFTVETEFGFHPVRMWRFDFFVPELNLGIEFDGLALGHAAKSRHTTVVGFTKDCDKANAAQILGFTIFRYTAVENHYENFATDFPALVKARGLDTIEKK